MALLNIQFRGLWEASRERRRGLPTYTTILKMLGSYTAGVSASSLQKMIRHMPFSRRAAHFLNFSLGLGYATPSLYAWLGVLEQSRLSEPALDYWQAALAELDKLGGVTFTAQASSLARYKVYNSANVTRQLGCPGSRARLSTLLGEVSAESDLDSCRQLDQAMVADGLAALLRLAAWFGADWQVANWAFQERESTENTLHGPWAVPHWCALTHTWSSPMEQALCGLAKLAGWSGKPKPVTYLGKLWAAADGKEASSCTRLLRNWVQLRPGRPSFDMLVGLVRACAAKQFEGGIFTEDERESYCRLNACVVRFAETLSRVLRDLQKEGYPTDLISSLMGVYETEYIKARALLGRPVIE